MSKEDYIKSIGLVDDVSTFEYDTLDAYDAEIEKLNEQINSRVKDSAANKNWWDYLGVAALGGNVGDAMLQDQQREYRSGETSKFVKRREELMKQRELMERRQKVDAYGAVKNEPDYTQRSAVNPAIEDPTYRWINDIDGYRGKAQDEYNREVQRAAATGNSDFPQGLSITMAQTMPDYYRYNYDMLNDDEVRTYNYLAATDPKRATAFLEDMRPVLQKRYSISEQVSTAEAYDKASGAGKLLLNVGSVPLNVVGNVMSAGNDALEAIKGEYSPYGSAHSLTNIATAIRGETAQDIIDKIDEAGGSDTVGQLASNAYQAVMSGADSALGAALFGKGYLLVAGAGAASQKAKELYERGASGPQILTGAVTSGLIEVALEKIPLDNLLNAKAATKTVRGLVASVLKQSGIEATEETLTEVSNIVADCIIQGSNSELSNLQKQYESKGESSEAAYRHALRDKATDVAWSGFGGFISGGASGLTFSTAGLVQYNAEVGRIGQSYIDGTDGHSVDEAISIGLDNAHTTEAYKLADAINKKVQSGQNVTAHEVGRMLVESSSAESAKARAIDHAVRESARQHGVAENIAEDVANIAAATGRTIEFADDAEFGVALEGDAVVAGSYDSSTGVVKINAAASREEVANFIIKHELTHSVEGTAQREQLEEIVRAKMGDDAFNDAVVEMMERRTASGQPIDMATAEQEVVANWIGDNLYKGGFAQAIVDGNATVGNAFVRTIDKLRLALGNKKSRANTRLEVMERLFMRALEQEVDLRKGDVEYAFKGYDSKTGKPIYESNFPIGTPKAAKAARILELIQTVWSKKPIELVIKDGEGQNRKIQAHFDPSYDAETGEQSDASKLMGGNRHGTASEQRVTLDLADDYYQIAADAVYNYSKDETGKDSVTHKGVSQWHYFINDILFQEYGKEEMTPFRVTINVKERSDGLFVYSFSAERQNKGSSTRQTLHADVTAVNNSSNARSNNSISEDAEKSNPQSKKISKNAVVSRAWLQGDTSVDRAGNAVESPMPSNAVPAETPVRSQVQNGEGMASAPIDSATVVDLSTDSDLAQRVEGLHGIVKPNSVNYEALRNAVTVDDVIGAVGDSEAFRRAYLASQVERMRGTVDVDGQTMSADEYMAEHYHALPDDETTIRDAIAQTEMAIAEELKEAAVNGINESSTTLPLNIQLFSHPNLLKLNIQLFAQKAKLEYVLDKGEEGSKTRRFFEQRLKGKDTNHNQELVDLLAGRNETYNPIANEKTLDKANTRLRDAKYADKLKRRILRYKPTDIFTDVDMAAAQVMINDTINAGELGEAADLIQGLSRKGTELGRAVQIMSMQARLTPEGTLRAMQRTLQKTADKVICDGASDSIDQIVEEIIEEIEARGGQRTANDEAVNVTVKSGLSALNESSAQKNTLAHMLASNLGNLQDMDPVVDLSGTEFNDRSKRLSEQIDEFFSRVGNRVVRRGFGEVALGEYGIDGTLSHKPVNRAKIVSIAAVPNVISAGRQINHDPNWKGRGYDSYIFAAPVTVNGTKVFVAAVVDKRPNNKFYLSEMVDSDGNYVRIEESPSGNSKNGVTDGADQFGKVGITAGPEGLSEGDNPSASSAEPIPHFNNSISESPQNVKREQLRDALVEDLAATEGNYLTKDEIGKLVDKAIDDSSNIPEQVRRYIKKHIKTGTLADRIYEMQQKGHINNVTLRRAMEEALGLPTLTESEIATVVDLATQIHALDADPVQQAEYMDELYDMLGRKLPVTAWEGITNWRKFGMLFNVKTHLRNIASNAAYSGVRKVDDLTATMIERLFVRDSSQWSKKLGWRKTEEGQALLRKIEKSADLAVLQMQKRGKYEYSGSPLENHRNLFGTSKLAETRFGKTADKASRWNSDMLEREDVIFFRPAYIDALGQIMTARHMTEVTPEVEAMAYQRAAEATFRADNAISDFISMLKQRGGKFRNFGAGMIDIAIPFNKTPANIATQSAWHSPIGIVKGALDLYNATKGKGSKTVADAINTLAKGTTGTALLIIGALLASVGHFNTGFGKTEKERAADELAGIQENSFVVGGASISVDWLQPAAAPLIIGASMTERLQDEGLTLGAVFGSLMDGTDALFDMSMMQSLYDLFGGYDTGVTATLGSVVENLISQSIPTVVGQTARSIDPVQRKTKGDGDFETMLNKILAKIPGLTYLLDPELDVWGDEVHRTGKATEWSWALNFLQQFALPFNTKVGTGTDAVSREIQRLYEGQGSSAVPTAITRDEAKDEGLDYVESNRLLGAVNRQAVEDFVNNKWPYTVQEELPNGKRRNVTKFYEDMTDEERVRVLKRIYKKAKEQVTDADEANDAYFADIMRRLE